MSLVSDAFLAVIDSVSHGNRKIYLSVTAFVLLYLLILRRFKVFQDLSRYKYGKNWELYVSTAAAMLLVMAFLAYLMNP